MSDCVGGKTAGADQRTPGEKGIRSSEKSVYESSTEETVKYKSSKESSLYQGSDEIGGNTFGIRHRTPVGKGISSSEKSVYESSAEETLRYKGSKDSSLYKGSEEYIEYCCGPCTTTGDHVEAQGFCIECGDYLCDICYKSHSRSRASRNHTLVDKDSMPKKYIACNPCKTVGDEEEAEGYCTDCSEYLCNNCLRSHSRSKASREHVLLGKDKMPRPGISAIVSSFVDMQIPRNLSEKYTLVSNINVKDKKDKSDCYITDIISVNISDVIIADHNNSSLKLVDLESIVLKSCLKLETPSCGLTIVARDEVAVVLDNKNKIQFISLVGGLSVVRTLKTNGSCVNVQCVNEKLYVSFKDPLKFEILQLTGAVCNTINPDAIVKKHCSLPRYMVVSPDESKIYISDWKINSLVCIDMNGRILHMYQGKLDAPSDITLSPFGSVYLCSCYQHAVIKMPSDLSESTVVLEGKDGLHYPKAVCCNDNKLYVTCGSRQSKYSDNFIKVYKRT